MSDKGITLEGLAAAVDALRQELATWKALARKQDALSADQITATQSGATAAKISQIAVNTAAIQSLAAQVAGQISLAYVTTLPATGEPLTLYLVPQGDGTAPNFCNEYLWINDAWELIGTTGAMANNGELTIQVNGVAVGTFTANQAANSAVNIAVPTNNNQLTNGAGYVDTAALQAALAFKQNSLNAAQLEAVNSGITAADVQQIADNATAISGKQDALTAAQQAAVDSGATAAKIDQIASNASAIVSLTSSKQDSLSTTQLAAVNSGVTAAAVQQIGTNANNISALQAALASKAADADVVHKAGAETIPGDKTFTGAVVTHNVTPETDNTYSLGSAASIWDSVYANTVNAANSISATNAVYTNTAWVKAVRAPGTSNALILAAMETWEDGGRIFMYGKDNVNGSTIYADIDHNDGNHSKTGVTLNTNGFYPSGVSRHLGLADPNNRWLTFNGINPGALSLPSITAEVDIASSIADVTGGDNWYVPPVDGYLSVVVQGTVTIMLFNTTHRQYYYGASCMQTDAEGNSWVCLPVKTPYHARIRAIGTVAKAVFYPCLGNV